MLQIISGKFYSDEDCYHTPCKSVIYGNVGLFNEINTSVVKIVPTSHSDNKVSSYVVEYDNCLQKPKVFTGFAMIKIGDREIVRQVLLLCSFATNAIFDTDKYVVEKLCRNDGVSIKAQDTPSKYVEKTLSYRNLDITETEFIQSFIDNVIGLPRKTYKAVMEYLSMYNASLRLLDEDVALAYSTLVYCIESLSQKFDEYNPVWDDYEQNKRIRLEKQFGLIAPEISERIKEILVSDSHLKLSKRFIHFVKSHLDEDYFSTDAQTVTMAIKQDEVEFALKKAYDIRSKLVHTLERPLKELTLANFSKNCDAFRCENDTFFTYNGLLRVARKVLILFVEKQKTIEREKFNWQDELPHQLKFRMHPKYWVHNIEGFHPNMATSYLFGFFSCYLSGELELPNISNVLEKFRLTFNNANKDNQISMVALIHFHNSIMAEEFRMEWATEFIADKSWAADVCCIQNFCIELFIPPYNIKREWDIEELEKVVIDYNKNKFKKGKLRLEHSILETLMYLAIANHYKGENAEKQIVWLEKAFYNSCGNFDLQEKIKTCIASLDFFDIQEYSAKKLSIDDIV